MHLFEQGVQDDALTGRLASGHSQETCRVRATQATIKSFDDRPVNRCVSSEAVDRFIDAAQFVAAEDMRLPIEVSLIGSSPDGIPFELESV